MSVLSSEADRYESRIIHLYGDKTARCIRLFEKLRIKKTRLLTFLTFLLCCKDDDTIPRFLQFHHHIHSWAANTIYLRTSFALLREGYITTDILHTYPPKKMEETECSETLAYKIQMPGNYPEESIQHSEHSESLKSIMIRESYVLILNNYKLWYSWNCEDSHNGFCSVHRHFYSRFCNKGK